jgi:hypothetical protein
MKYDDLSYYKDTYKYPKHAYVSIAGAMDYKHLKSTGYFGTIAFYINVFKNSKDVKLFKTEAEFYDQYFAEQLSVEKFGQKYVDEKKAEAYFSETRYIYKNALLHINNYYSQDKKDELIKKFKSFIDSHKFKYSDELTDSQYAKMEKEVIEKDKKEINGWMDTYTKEIEDKLDSYIKKLSSCKKDKLTSIVNKIKKYSDVPVVKDKYGEAMNKAKEVAEKYGITINY